jgi:tripartite-type tricarboxylate transporter receptor subunit TctC
MEEKLGVPVIVVNKTGGGGLVGFKAIADAKPDGYTIGSISISLLLQKAVGLAYQDFRELTPIGIYNEDPASLTVNADAPWSNLDEFVEYCKDNPETVRVSNSGTGAIWHVSALRMEKFLGIKVVHIPYKGGNPAAVAVAGGHVEVTTTSPAEVASLVNAGKLKILAIPSEKRVHIFPDVPTFKEEGYDFTAGTWRGLAGPAGLPEEVTKKLKG